MLKDSDVSRVCKAVVRMIVEVGLGLWVVQTRRLVV